MEKGEYTGLQADLFAAGVILFIMYNGTPPFMCTKPTDKIYKLIKDQSFAKFWSLHEKKKPLGFYPDSFKRLVNEFLSFDPLKRPTLVSLS
jgi:serine/threonine protein kinase